MEAIKVPLRKATGPSKKRSWKERVQVHKNVAAVKYGRLLGTREAAAAQEPVTDDAENGVDTGYYGPATLGGQPFQLLFDTGSSDLWVPIKGYNNGESNSHHTFVTSKSSTFSTKNVPFAITYGSGSTSGIAASDTFKIAGYTIKKQVFGLADTVSSDFATSPFDGILGMGFDTLSELRSPTPFQNLVQDNDVSSSVFSFLLGRVRDKTSSELILGGIDPNFSNNIVDNKVVNSRGFWQIALDGAAVNGNAIEVSSSDAIIDTGTTLVLIPTADADAIHNAIPGATTQSGTYLVPTNTKAKVSFAFGGVSYDINTEDLVFEEVGNGLSVSGIQGGNLPGMESTWLVGDVFLKNVCSTYDINKKTVGFAPRE